MIHRKHDSIPQELVPEPVALDSLDDTCVAAKKPRPRHAHYSKLDVFTGDRLWAAFDVDDRRVDVFANFLQTSRGHEKLMELYWCFGCPVWDGVVPENCRSNMYLYLGYISNATGMPDELPSDRHILKLIIDLNPDMFRYFAKEDRDQFDLGLQACQKDSWNIAHVTAELRRNKAFLKRFLKSYKLDMY